MRLRETLRQVLENPSLRRLEIAWLIGIAAEKAFLVVLLVYGYEIGGVVAVGILTMLASLPAGLFGPVLSSVAESFPPARALLGIHLGRGLVVGAAALALGAGLDVGFVVAATIVEGILSRQHAATTRSLLPAVARTPDELIAGNAVTSLAEAVGALAGPAIAGVLLATGGTSLGLAGPAMAYLAAAGVVLSLQLAAISRAGGTSVRGESWLMGAMGGFRALRAYRSAALLVSLFLSQVFVRGLLTVLLVSAAIELLGIGNAGVGYLNSGYGAGGLLGAVLVLTIVASRNLAPAFVLSLAMWGLPIAIMGLAPQPILAFALIGLVGAANAAIDVTGYTLLARCVPNEVRGRIFGLLHSFVGIGVAAGALVAPLLVQAAGLQAALVIAGLILPIVAAAAYAAVRRADAAAVLPVRELALMRQVPMFAPLPLTALEQLARSLVPVRLEPGTRVITQGEPGDAYYLIADGSVDVIHDGRRQSTLGPGEGFGEIALLSDRPRTATIEVVEQMDGYSLPRAAFLEAVTGSSHSALAADELMESRLTRFGR